MSGFVVIRYVIGGASVLFLVVSLFIDDPLPGDREDRLRLVVLFAVLAIISFFPWNSLL